MILYFAASFIPEDVIPILEMGHKNILFSYHYFAKHLELLKEWRTKYKITILIDSGAFSAWTANVSIDIDQYIIFLKRLRPRYYAVLDDIVDPDKTIYNQKHMEKAGLNPIPTFHVGEPEKYLHYYLDRPYKYLALGGMVRAENLDEFLHGVWPIIYGKRPDLRVHGFGLTSVDAIAPYPFYSVDSSSYLSPMRYGLMFKWSRKKKVIYVEKFMKGQKMTKQNRYDSTKECAGYYIEMAEYINQYQKNKDFRYLLNQQTLFT